MSQRVPVFLALLLFALLLQPPPIAEAGTKPDSLSIKIGQMLMVGFRGTTIGDAPDVRRAIDRQRIGGVVLFDYDVPSRTPLRNITGPEQLQRLNGELQERSPVPLFISIDQEGGMVSRLKPARGFPRSPSARSLGLLRNPDSTLAAAEVTARTLQSMGVNMNLAPVVDLDTNPQNPVIGRIERSYSPDPDIVSSQAAIVTTTFLREGIIPVLKHFPGHGSSTSDSHLGFTDVTESWSEIELEPYRSLLLDGYQGAIMTAHVFNARLDPRYPATLSKATISGLLREKLGFRGVVLTDDMQMGAIAQNFGFEEAVRLSIEAGADILVFANNTAVYDPKIAEKASGIIRRMVDEGIISPLRIEESYRRIMTLKETVTHPAR
ncbi:glycoside hydrolase family 3 protein [Pelodictyon luteolum]|uniref:beta-N-acetylhexosaminidase n=1 Tax=Chlorobium luteolum (strain DSM 273 / BCRC 81028 / 2530) TaxID=319225 RepID=Q3B184_CHLL3|nr:glycoside hydrolase family 3 protein [Pelodictyon luteolum]ABB24897.1 glycosyl hydrolase, family 3 [Pelodictyon luteolum DSM 273]